MRNIENAFFILGIEITKDKREIKKAYGNKVKEYHPEEQPELWQRVRSAYKEALDYAEGDSKEEEDPTPIAKEEQQDYRNVFIDAQAQDANKYQNMVRQTVDALFRLSRMVGIQNQADWIHLLGSEHFNQTWDDDIVLQTLMTTLSQVKFTPDTTRLVINRLESMRQRFVTSMQSYKVKQVENMLQTVANQNVAYTGQGMQPMQKKKSVALVWTLLIAVICIAGIVLLGTSLMEKTSHLSEYEAEALIITYLEEKYPDLIINEETAYTSDFSELREQTNDSVKIGYEMRFEAPKEAVVKLFFWETEDGGVETACFDNLQSKQIETDMKAKVQEVTGMQDILVFLSGKGDEGVRALSDYSGGLYQEVYEGDLQAFFEQEASQKRKVLGAVNEIKDPDIPTEQVNPNGKCMIYVKDPDVTTVQERLKNQSKLAESGMETGLFEMEEAYQLKVWALGLPGEEYEELTQIKKGESYGAEEKLISGENTAYHTPNILPSIATVWYQNKDQVTENGIQVPEVIELGEGMYGVLDWERTDTTKALYDEEIKEAFAEVEEQFKAINKHSYKMKKTDMPKETEAFLKSQGVVPNNPVSVNISCKGVNPDMYVVVNKEDVGLTDGEYEYVYQDSNSTSEETPCEFRTVVSNITEATSLSLYSAYNAKDYLVIGYSEGYTKTREATFTFYE